VVCFFFQAEDGIRDFHVTRVQTCALPIFGGGLGRRRSWGSRLGGGLWRWVGRGLGARRGRIGSSLGLLSHARVVAASYHGRGQEIGRASCRERVAAAMGAGR